MELTKDDERARRLCSLALEFMNATRPIASSDIARAFYPNLSADSFRRAFSRDRETLFACGMAIEDAREAGGEASWYLEERNSFVQKTDLSPLDAAALEVACQPFLEDGTFPLADDLRLALAKISNAFAEPSTAPSPTPAAGGARPSRQHAALLSCVLSSHAAKISYTDAKGSASERTIAPYAFFELWGTLYLVAGRVDEGGQIVDGGTRTYRLDRVTAATPLKSITFHVPEDFSVLDWRRLPFQMGDARATGVFEVPTERRADVEPASLGQGRFEEQLDGSLLWTVPVADVRTAASWAVAEGIFPTEPPELVEAWKNVFREVIAHA